jgi:hypothetical protein
MREIGFFLLAIVVTLAVLATIDPDASSPRHPSPATSVPYTRR